MNVLYPGARNALLQLLRIPPEPDPPAGAPGSLRVFRAGRNYYRLRFWIWTAKQVAALLGFLFTLWVIHQATISGLDQWHSRAATRGQMDQLRLLNRLARYDWVLPTLECLGFALALLQLPFTYALLRLDYEQRWYLVTDRSLRIREGITTVREMTLSFANIQQTTLQQGPLQRFLGLADLVVTTAGGGGQTHGQPGVPTTPWHTGVLHAVDNAGEIRDLIQSHLRRLKSSGIGDADEPAEISGPSLPAATPRPVGTSPTAAVEAAHALLTEVRALRQVVEAPASAGKNAAG